MQEYTFLAMVSNTIRKKWQRVSVGISILTFVEKIHSMHRHVIGDISALLKGRNVLIGGDVLGNRSWRLETSNIRAEFANDISLVGLILAAEIVNGYDLKYSAPEPLSGRDFPHPFRSALGFN